MALGNCKTGGKVGNGSGLKGTSGFAIIKNVPIITAMLKSSMRTVIRSKRGVRPFERPFVARANLLIGSYLVKPN